MATAKQSQSDVKSWESVQKEHDGLQDQFESEKLMILGNSGRRNDFVDSVQKLLKDLRDLAKNVESTDQYKWLNSATTQWQRVFSTSLGIPRDIREEIGLNAPRANLKVSGVPADNAHRLHRDDCKRMLDQRSYDIGMLRKWNNILNRLYQFGVDPHRIHQEVPSNEEEQAADWLDAQLFFASDVLERKIHFTLQLATDTYPQLQEVWLQDLKRIKAYVAWRHAGGDWDARRDGEFYLAACDDIHSLLVDPALKSDSGSFAPIESWLRATYMDGDSVSLVPNSAGWQLVKHKAERIWQTTGRCDRDANWRDAEQYVLQFYNHAILAFRDQAGTSVEALLSTFRNDSTHSCELTSVFEACLVAYFLDADVIVDHLPKSSFV